MSLAVVVLPLVAIAVAFPVTAFLLRRARWKKRRALTRRVTDGEIIAGVGANWLEGKRGLRWSGHLVITPDGMLRWEPDSASISRRRATPSAWDQDAVRLDVLSRGRGFTGELYERVRLTVAGSVIANFAVFAEAGPWHQTLALPPAAFK